MNFFEQQRLAKRNSKLLIFLFFIAVVAVSIGTGFICLVAFGAMEEGSSSSYRDSGNQQQLLIAASLIVMVILSFASLIKSLSLSKNGSDIAKMLGGRQVNQRTQDLLERRLLNVVEEMSLASRVPVPDVFVLHDEAAINAFAAGVDINHAAVAVTKGTLENLNREELQAVIAHEFSHILNGDSKINIKMVGYLFGISCIFETGRILTRSTSRRSRRSKGGELGLALLVVGGLGMLFASWIKAFISREREYLADASAVQYTRNGDAVARVLKKLMLPITYSSIDAPKTGEFSHMFFSKAIKSGFFSLSTHPPLMNRIQAIYPNYSQAEFESEEQDLKKQLRRTIERNKKAQPEPSETQPSQEGKEFIQNAAILVGTTAALANQVGTINKSSLEQSHEIFTKNNAFLDSISSIDDAEKIFLALCQNSEEVKDLSINEKEAVFIRSIEQFSDRSTSEKYDYIKKLYGDITDDQKISHSEWITFVKVRELLAPTFLIREGFLPKVSRTIAVSTLVKYIVKLHPGNEVEQIFAESSRLYFRNLLSFKVETSPMHVLASIDYCKSQSPNLKNNLTMALLKCVEADGKISKKEYDAVAMICTCLQIPMPLNPEDS